MKQDLEPYTARLRGLPFIRDVRILPGPDRADGLQADTTLVLTAVRGFSVARPSMSGVFGVYGM